MSVHHNSQRSGAIGRVDATKKRAKPAFQIAALVYRGNGKGLEILLVTSRETHRWILPKGWPIAGKTPAMTAEREAEEEAGIFGHAAKKPLGRYSAVKRIGETVLPCEIEVYALRFTKQKPKWKERGQRDCQWLPVAEAAETVAEPELAAIIRGFAVHMRPSETLSRTA